MLVALAWQVRYAEETAACARDPRLIVCCGPLDSWVLPATLLIGLALVALRAGRLIASRP